MNRKEANELLKLINKEINESNEGKIDLNGKMYTTVARRIELFRKHFGIDCRLNTEILEMTEDSIVSKCIVEIYIEDCYIQVGMGHAQKFRGKSQMSLESGLEMCETSAKGRALADLGISGGEFASSNEILDKQEKKPEIAKEKPVAKPKGPFKKNTVNTEDMVTGEQMKVLMRIKNIDDYLSSYKVMKASQLTKVQASDIIEQDKGEIPLWKI